MMRILMCRPTFYGIAYEINPWMNIKKKTNHPTALHQWQLLHNTLLNCGATIDLVAPVKGWPDMTFTANAGLFYQNKFILSHFKDKERQGETPYFQAWFEKAGFELVNTEHASDSPFFEGTGDALSAGDHLFVGYGFRSERLFYEKAAYFNQDRLVYCELADAYFYHLDTCFCPITDTLALWYPDAFTKESQQVMSKHIELLAVNAIEAKHFACNAVVLDKHVILPKGCPNISARLKKYGFIPHACDMSEYLKAGGACKCLTLRLD